VRPIGTLWLELTLFNLPPVCIPAGIVQRRIARLLITCWPQLQDRLAVGKQRAVTQHSFVSLALLGLIDDILSKLVACLLQLVIRGKTNAGFFKLLPCLIKSCNEDDQVLGLKAALLTVRFDDL